MCVDNSARPYETAATIRGVMADLTLISRRLPAGAGESERIADLLDQLSRELAQAAQVLRAE